MTKYVNIEAIKQNSLHLQGNTRTISHSLNKKHTVIGVREREKKGNLREDQRERDPKPSID